MTIRSKPSTKEFRDNFDRIFRKKKKGKSNGKKRG